MEQSLLTDKKKKKHAYITIVSVLLLMVVSSSIIFTALMISSSRSVNNKTMFEAERTKYIAQGCVEIVLNNLKLNTSYSGNEVINLLGGSCSVSAITGSGNAARSFSVNATFGGSTKIYNVSLSVINPTLLITGYSE